MRTSFFVSILILYAAALSAQVAAPAINRTHAEKQFNEAKNAFVRFEKAHGRFIQTNNVRMHYLTWGKSSGIPLIWAHGSFSNGYELLPIADRLVKAGYYIIAIDYYGHGQTPIPAHEVSLYHVADDLKFLMDQLKIPKAVIGGWSRGGAIATAFYDTYPERVLGLILEDGGSVAMNTHYHKMEPEQLENTIRAQEIEKHKAADTLYASELEAFYSLYDSTEKADPFYLFAYIRKLDEGKWALNPGLFELFHLSSSGHFLDIILRPTRVPLFAASMAMLEPKIVYRKLHVPLLILDPVSADDYFPFEEENQALQNQHPHLIEHKIYKDTGHAIHYERPDQFINDLTLFLNRLKAN